MTRRLGQIAVPALLAALAATPGCRDPMQDQPRHEPLESSPFFADGRASRRPPLGTVARGHLGEDVHLATGRLDGELTDEFPMDVTMELLRRGRERYDIFCSACHGLTGDGRGIVVRRGFRAPPSFHGDAMKKKSSGHVVEVIAKGFGAMSSYAGKVAPRDRWAIAAYVRALQLSRSARLEDVPEPHRSDLERRVR